MCDLLLNSSNSDRAITQHDIHLAAPATIVLIWETLLPETT